MTLQKQSQLIAAVQSFIACELESQVDAGEVFDHLNDGETDFEVDGVRFISDTTINQVLADELFNECDCTVGYFNPHFIAQYTSLPLEAVEALQAADAHEALGKSILAITGPKERLEFAQGYQEADGYGHHFNYYDGTELELDFGGELYHVFNNED